MSKQPFTFFAPRGNTLQYLDSLDQKHYIYIFAPSGYGKTITTHMWLERKGVRHAFVSLDEGSDKPGLFCTMLCRAMMQCQPDNRQLAEYATHREFGSAPMEYTLQAINTLREDSRAYIVIDDLHFIGNAEILRFLPVFLRRLPANITVVLLSRREPPETFSELIVKNQMAFVTKEVLCFTRDEIIAFFAQAGFTLSEQQAASIYQATEGWAIGVNAMLLSGREPSTRRLMERHLESFIRTRIWENWEPAVQNFLLQTAFEEDLTTSLCEALTDGADCAPILEGLQRENAFLLAEPNGYFRFHSLFRTFLLHQAAELGEDFRNRQMLRSARWYESEKMFYKAVDRYAQCGDNAGIARCYTKPATERDVFIIDEATTMARKLLKGPLLEEYPFLYSTRGWVAYLDGEAEEMANSFDRYYALFPQIAQQTPGQESTLMLVRCLDYRTPMHELAAQVVQMPFKPPMGPASGTISQNMPLFHRSSRDFSEYAVNDMNAEVSQLKAAIGDLFGAEQDMLEECLKAGLLYEQGDLNEAHRLAISANSRIQDGTAAESRFCAMILLAHVCGALWQFDQVELMFQQIQDMIEQEKAYYLSNNFDAYRFRCRLMDGDEAAAKEWLAECSYKPGDSITFFPLYSFFTTARAYIVLGRYDMAILILDGILDMCSNYQRPLDVIEARILLAICYWKKKRGHQQTAMQHLEQGILLAKPYGYTQVFANEGADLTNMLHRLQNRVVRQDYHGDIPGSFSKMLHLQALSQSHHTKGLTGRQDTRPVKFTEKQLAVMKLMCEGYSYRQIAELTGVKFSTIRSHIELIYKKLDVPNE
ncbi:LuxR C-terminal-related transcriptional regulator, partial [Ruminococcaceae bacterium OttesenSCG-928-L11]|nr:LuxR C-terminal-related transcriptional regulator [Ruminococcaceae bacterium OttesenSCG-928-L11]